MTRVSFLLVTATVAIITLLASAVHAAPFPRQWQDLFDPPYNGVPQIIMALGCVGDSMCFVPSMTNGVGVQIQRFNGQPNGVFTPMGMAKDPMPGKTMMLYIGAGGTPSAPHGAIAGVELGDFPWYIVNSSYLSESLEIPFIGTTSVAADRPTGMTTLMINEMGGSGISVSNNGGETWSVKQFSGPLPTDNCTWGMYYAAIDSKNWYVTFGSNPAKRNSKASSQEEMAEMTQLLRKSGMISNEEIVIGKTSKVSWVARSTKTKRSRNVLATAQNLRRRMGLPVKKIEERGCPYSAAIMKTMDGGNTWSTVFSSINQGYQMEFIDCANATHCVATADGDSGTINNPSLVFTTTDGGASWKKTLELTSNATTAIYTNAVSFVPTKEGEVWVGVTVQSESNGMTGIMYGSKDSGLTWTKQEDLAFIGAVTSISCAMDGTCFSSAITAMSDSTILKYNANGPPAPPTPSWKGKYTQKACTGSGDCTGNCTTTQLAQNSCLQINGLMSMMAQCDLVDKVLVQKVFLGTPSCAEGSQEQFELVPLDQCVETQNGGTMMVTCGPTETPVTAAAGGQAMIPRINRKH